MEYHANGKKVISTKPRLKSASDFSLLCCFIVLLCVCLLSPAVHNIYHTPVARYSVSVLKVLLNTNQLTNQLISNPNTCNCFTVSHSLAIFHN